MSEMYGKCKTCELDLPTQDEAREHMLTTLEASGEARRGHTIRVLNPPPADIARRIVADIVAKAMDEACEELYRRITGGRLTREDAEAALKDYPDFEETWEEYWAESLKYTDNATQEK